MWGQVWTCKEVLVSHVRRAIDETRLVSSCRGKEGLKLELVVVFRFVLSLNTALVQLSRCHCGDHSKQSYSFSAVLCRCHMVARSSSSALGQTASLGCGGAACLTKVVSPSHCFAFTLLCTVMRRQCCLALRPGHCMVASTQIESLSTKQQQQTFCSTTLSELGAPLSNMGTLRPFTSRTFENLSFGCKLKASKLDCRNYGWCSCCSS